MKTIKTLGSIFTLALTLLLTACSSDSSGGSTSGFYLQAKVDGVSYSNSDLFEPSGILAAGTLMIQSSDNSGNSIQIQIPNYDGVGTYNSGNNNLMNGYVNYMKMGATIGQFQSFTSVRGTGQVIVTAASETSVEGTFTATAPENVEGSSASVTITEGEFRIDLSE